MPSGSRHIVAVLALPDVVAFDLAIPAQVFGHRDERDRYALRLCAATPGPVATTAGFDVVATHGLEGLVSAGTVIVPGFEPAAGARVGAGALAALREAHAREARVVSICTGAFALAEAGLLDGRRATTHWRDAARLAREHPAVEVDPDVLYVDGGDGVMTSAGVSAGIDLALHLAALDHGAAAAAAIARRMVVAPVRQGGQAQYVERPVPRGGAAAGLSRTREWMLGRLGESLSLRAMAAHAGYSERSFSRRFRAETGLPPLRWLHGQRVQEARRLLETTDADLEAVAAATGFGTAATLRLHFGRTLGTTPSAYRSTWRAAAPRERADATSLG